MLVACGDDGSPQPTDGPLPGDGGPIDMAPGDSSSLASTCTGTCAATALTATFGSATRSLDAAYFGVSSATQTLYVEAYGGAAAGCPEQNSPTPKYTLILGRIPMPSSTAMVTSPANLLDFQGDLLPSPAPMAATSVTLMPVAKNATQVALDVQLVFPSGMISGHLFATHCASLDD